MAYVAGKIYEDYVIPACAPGCDCLIQVEMMSKLSEIYDRVCHAYTTDGETWEYELGIASDCKTALLAALQDCIDDITALT